MASRYAQEARPFALATAAATTATWAVLVATRRQTRTAWVGYGAAVLVCGLANVISLLILPAHGGLGGGPAPQRPRLADHPDGQPDRALGVPGRGRRTKRTRRRRGRRTPAAATRPAHPAMAPPDLGLLLLTAVADNSSPLSTPLRYFLVRSRLRVSACPGNGTQQRRDLRNGLVMMSLRVLWLVTVNQMTA